MDKVTIGNSTLILADCRDVINGLPFDSIITDPPYGLAKLLNRSWDAFGKIWNKKQRRKNLHSGGTWAAKDIYQDVDWDDETPDLTFLLSKHIVCRRPHWYHRREIISLVPDAPRRSGGSTAIRLCGKLRPTCSARTRYCPRWSGQKRVRCGMVCAGSVRCRRTALPKTMLDSGIRQRSSSVPGRRKRGRDGRRLGMPPGEKRFRRAHSKSKC